MDRKCSLMSAFLLVLYLDTTIAKTKVYDNLKVESGTRRCISDCTHKASGKRTVICSIKECTTVEEASSAALPPEIKRVFLERYRAKKRNKIALHVEWSPVDNVSLQSGTGFMLNISDGTSSYSRCYHVTTPQDFNLNKHDKYINNCFGKVKNTVVRPGSDIMVNISSLPIRSDYPAYGLTEAIMKVPDCGDVRMQDITNCINPKSSDILTAKVERIVCENRSMVYSYEVSSRYGQYATIIFCEVQQELDLCKNLTVMENLPLSNRLYSISLPSSANLSAKYTTLVYGIDHRDHSYPVYPDFSKCIKETPTELPTVVLVILVLGVLAFCSCIVAACLCYRKRKFDKWKHLDTVSVPMTEMRPPTPPTTVAVPDNVRVFVIFADDHEPEQHDEVVHWFCSYLQQDLGLVVKVSLWQLSEVATNTVHYVMSNLNFADKVIIICSEGSKYCLETSDRGNSVFAAAVRNIRDRTLENPEKYFVVYFDYSKYEHIPDFLLCDQRVKYFSVFKLMEEFERFYFRLIGIEQYQEGGFYQIDEITCQHSHTSTRENLRESIIQMIEFVERNPNWYRDQSVEEITSIQLQSVSTETKPKTLLRNNGLDSLVPRRTVSVTAVPKLNIDHLFTSLSVPENGTKDLLSQKLTTNAGSPDALKSFMTDEEEHLIST